jgi:hypothetical protein
VVVRAGETVEVVPGPSPPPAPGPPLTVPAAPGGSLGPNASAPQSGGGQRAPALVRRETEHPFSPTLFAISGTLALAAGIAAVPLENHAWELNRTDQAQWANGKTITAEDRQNFSDARAWAYGAVGAAIGLGLLTAGLATWYFFGTSQREVVITSTGVGGRF